MYEHVYVYEHVYEGGAVATGFRGKLFNLFFSGGAWFDWPMDDGKPSFPKLDVRRALLVVVDVQGRLAEVMDGREALFLRLEQLIRGWRALGLPLLVTEQLPDKIGPTIPRLAQWIEDLPRVVKSRFSCCGVPAFDQALADSGREQILLAGIEAHICICQTALDLLARGREVFVARDAVSSRLGSDRDTALRRLELAGAQPVGVEMALFELLGDASHPAFRDILGLIK